MKRLAIFDVDYTITKKETFMELYKYSIEENKKNLIFLPRAIFGGLMYVCNVYNEKQVKEKRIESLYENDKNSNIRISHQNPDIIKIYNEYLEKPLSSRAEELLHTTYQDRSNILK